MTADAIKEHGSDWSNQVSVAATTRRLQCDQTLPLPVKGVACETMSVWKTWKTGLFPVGYYGLRHTAARLLWSLVGNCFASYSSSMVAMVESRW